MTEAIFKGDDTRHFGNNFITIKIKNKHAYEVSKIEAITNASACIDPKSFTDPDNFARENIEIVVNYTSEETPKLNNGSNVLNLVAYDMHNYPYTLPQSLTFYAQNGVIHKNGRFCC